MNLNNIRAYGVEPSFLKLPKFFQSEKELLHRRNIIMLPETEKAEGQGIISSLVVGRLTTPLLKIRSQIEQGQIDEDSIDSHLRFYLKKDVVPIYRQHLLSIALMCIQRAREETHSTKQLPLLFKAVDMLRTYIQYSDEAMDIMASSIVIHIFSTFPSEFEEKWELEKSVFQAYVELFKTRKRTSQIGFGDKDNIGLRIKIARLSAQQKNFYDSLVQFTKILDLYRARSDDDPQVMLNRVRTHAWIGNIFQDLIHYAQPGKATILVNFINRYNRDNMTRKKSKAINILSRNDEVAIRQTKKDLIRIANEQYHTIESIGAKIREIGFKVTDGVIAGLTDEKFRPHLLKTLKAMKGDVFDTQEGFNDKLDKLSSPKPNNAQRNKIWVYVSSDQNNLHQGVMLQLKRNNKWIEVNYESMVQLSKNYQYLNNGDSAVKYANLAYAILKPISDRRYLIQKRDALKYVHEICNSNQLSFRNMTKRQLREMSAELRDETKQLNEIVDKEIRDRHIAAAKVLAR